MLEKTYPNKHLSMKLTKTFVNKCSTDRWSRIRQFLDNRWRDWLCRSLVSCSQCFLWRKLPSICAYTLHEDRPEIFDRIQIWRRRRPHNEPFAFLNPIGTKNVLVIRVEWAGSLSWIWADDGTAKAALQAVISFCFTAAIQLLLLLYWLKASIGKL